MPRSLLRLARERSVLLRAVSQLIVGDDLSPYHCFVFPAGKTSPILCVNFTEQDPTIIEAFSKCKRRPDWVVRFVKANHQTRATGTILNYFATRSLVPKSIPENAGSVLSSRQSFAWYQNMHQSGGLEPDFMDAGGRVTTSVEIDEPKDVGSFRTWRVKLTLSRQEVKLLARQGH